MKQEPEPKHKEFAPTGKYFEIGEGYYKWSAGEAYAFLEWGGVAIRLIGTEVKDIIVFSEDQVREITKEEFQKSIRKVNLSSIITDNWPNWNPYKPINQK